MTQPDSGCGPRRRQANRANHSALRTRNNQTKEILIALPRAFVIASLVVVGVACSSTPVPSSGSSSSSARDGDGGGRMERSWLAGDHHIHSQFSVGYETAAESLNAAPTPILGGDAPYGIPLNAAMARKHGLAWMVSTDHGGPNHSKLNAEQAYPELLRSRKAVPGVIQFYGMEFDTPGADHSSLIVPHSHTEREILRDVEARFSKYDAFPIDSARDTEPKMLDALRYMGGLGTPPVVIANHPARSASAFGVYGLDSPRELRDWNDAAPRVAIGMEGAPGHQAGAMKADGSLDAKGIRGGYRNAPTMGGFDQLTARLGGFWDSMLGEGRRWWITSTSDSHLNYRDGGSDFWPGEYSKTYVMAARSHADILDGLRNGRVFVTTGDLIAELDVSAMVRDLPAARAEIGGTLTVPRDAGGARDVEVTIRVRDPRGANHRGDTVSVARIDLIVGDITGPATERNADRNTTTVVVHRFTPTSWSRNGEYLTMSHTLRNVHHASYIRVRGTNTAELEPLPDTVGENPWSDLWFYSNPIFIRM